MTFHVGQKVVCVDCEWTDWNGLPAHDGFLPRKDSVYQIADVVTAFAECTYLRLCEAAPDEMYEASAFRPIVEKKTDISIFTAMLDRERHELPVRVIATNGPHTHVSPEPNETIQASDSL